MTASPAGPATDLGVRDLLSSLNALQMLSMVMIDASDEDEVLELAASAVPSLGRDWRMEGIWLDGHWRAVQSPRAQVGRPPGLEAQLTLVEDAGGILFTPDRGWLCAFPITGWGGASGCLVVGSPEPPPDHEQALLRTLAQQTGVALSHARLLQRERIMHGRVADEQATLRRVATLVARGVPPEEVFAAVAAEAGRLLDADYAVMSRYEADGGATVVGAWSNSGAEHPLPVGTRIPRGGTNVHSLVYRTGRPSRVDDYGDAEGIGATTARRWGIGSVVAVPIHIGGSLWGAIGVASRRQRPLPGDTDGWLAGFTELVAAAIANAQAQVELRSQSEEQAALRRVATLVARAAVPRRGVRRCRC